MTASQHLRQIQDDLLDPNAYASLALIDALPALIAVIAAAEVLLLIEGLDSYEVMEGWKTLGDSLAALREQLEANT